MSTPTRDEEEEEEYDQIQQPAEVEDSLMDLQITHTLNQQSTQLILVPPNFQDLPTQQLLSAVDSESGQDGEGISSMALTGFTNTLPMLKTHYQDDMMLEASRATNVNPIQPYLSSNPSINVDNPKQIQEEMTHGQGLLFLASLYKRNNLKAKLAEISEEKMDESPKKYQKLFNQRSRGNGYYDNTYVKMFNMRNSTEQKSPSDKGGNNIKRFKIVKLPEILNSPKVQNSPEERGAFGKLSTIFHKQLQQKKARKSYQETVNQETRWINIRHVNQIEFNQDQLLQHNFKPPKIPYNHKSNFVKLIPPPPELSVEPKVSSFSKQNNFVTASKYYQPLNERMQQRQSDLWNDKSFKNDSIMALSVDGSQPMFYGSKNTEYIKRNVEVKRHYRVTAGNPNSSMSYDENSLNSPSISILKSNRTHLQKLNKQTVDQTNVSSARIKMKESINKDIMNISHAASKFFDEQPYSPIKLSTHNGGTEKGHRRYMSNQLGESATGKPLLPIMASLREESQDLLFGNSPRDSLQLKSQAPFKELSAASLLKRSVIVHEEGMMIKI